MALNVADVRYVPRAVEMDPDGSFVLEPGDLLFTRYSGNPEYVGACAMVPAQAPRLLYPDKLIRVQVDRALVDPRFVEIAANAGETRRVIRSRVKTTAGQTGISGSDLKSVPFPVPPLTVQQRIVDEVDTALAPTKRLGEQLDLMLRRSSSLRATTLVSAFSGKLVPQDPNDEPASVLLERISAERATSNGHRPTTARSRRKIAT
jgi:type I restriction enzyme S subunit